MTKLYLNNTWNITKHLPENEKKRTECKGKSQKKTNNEIELHFIEQIC